MAVRDTGVRIVEMQIRSSPAFLTGMCKALKALTSGCEA